MAAYPGSLAGDGALLASTLPAGPVRLMVGGEAAVPTRHDLLAT